jgi:hypothetical protein
LHRRRRVADDRVEIDHGIEFAARTNPTVNGLPQLLAVRALRRERIIDGAVKRRQRSAIDVEALGVRPHDELPISGNQLIGRHQHAYHATRLSPCHVLGGAVARMDLIKMRRLDVVEGYANRNR